MLVNVRCKTVILYSIALLIIHLLFVVRQETALQRKPRDRAYLWKWQQELRDEWIELRGAADELQSIVQLLRNKPAAMRQTAYQIAVAITRVAPPPPPST